MQLVAALPPGTFLGENKKYKILGVCGQGGFGITYTGWDVSLERNVAIKECFPQEICVRDTATMQIAPRTPALQDAYLLAMEDLHKEARLLARLNHPNIVQVHDVFTSNGGLFCVMHWLEGDTLRNQLDSAEAADAPIPPEQSEAWLRKLLETLDYMHAQGVIHRDIKPENIMFDENGRPVMVDFGSAAKISRIAHTLSQGAFSAAYAAPEQISGKGKIGPWTDLYSLAATWYEVFSNCAAEETVRRMMDDSLAPLEKLVPERVHATPLMAAGIMRNLELHAADRCQSAAEWLAMLDGRPQPHSPRRQGKRRGLLWAGALATAVLAWCIADLATAPRGEDGETSSLETAGIDEEVDLDALTERAWDYYGIGKLQEKNRQFEADGAKLSAQFSADCSKLLERCRGNQALIEDSEPADREFEGIAAAYKEKLHELDEQYEREVVRPFRAAMESMESGQGWPGLSTAQKLALMHAVSSRINSKLIGQCENYNFYILNSTSNFHQLESQEKSLLENMFRKARTAQEEGQRRQRKIQQQQQQRQREIDKERMTGELYAKVHAQSGMVELMQKAEQMKKEYAAIPAEGLQAMERIAGEGIAKAKAAHMKECFEIQSDTDMELLACEREYEKKMSDFRKRFHTEVEQTIVDIINNCDRSSTFTFVTEGERDLLPDIRNRIRKELEPYRELPYVAEADKSAAGDMLRKGIKEVKEQKEAERDAAVESLYRKVVDEKKLETLAERRNELNRQRRELFKECDEELERYAARVVPQIKARPRKEWAAAINAAEQGVSSIEYDYQLKEKPLIEESQKVASVARSYLDRMEKGKGEEFANLTDAEKELLPDVSRMAGEKVDGGHWKWNVTTPMVETNAFYRTRYIESRVYKDVDMDALQEENEKETMRELGL